MTVALIIAAGTGQRMHLDTPKQFLRVRGKPVLVHTLERFQNHPEIDAILAQDSFLATSDTTFFASQLPIT